MSGLIWKEIDALWLLWVLPAVALVTVIAHRRTRSAARRLVGDVMTRRLMPDLSGAGPALRAGLFIVGVGLVVIALARPCWDYDYITVDARGVDVVVALDVSRSMLADDGDESRLDRAKAALANLVDGLPGDRVGLLLFAGDRVLTCPLTYDRGFFSQVLEDASPQSVGLGGTRIGPALEESLEVLDAEHGRDKVCVLVTDAGDQDSFPKTAAERLAKRKVRVIALGIGRTDAANAPLVLDGQVVRRADGTPVPARVDEALLRHIVESTRGLYIPPEQTHRLRELYGRYVDPLEKGDAKELQEKQYRERYQWFLLPGLVLLLLQAIIPNYARGRGGSGRVIVPLLLAGSLLAACSGNDDAATVAAATRALQVGDAGAAVTALKALADDREDDAVLVYDLACAHQGAGHDDEARKLFGQVLALGERSLRARTEVNLSLLDVSKLGAVCGGDPADAGETVREEIRGLADVALSRLQRARDLDPSLAAAGAKQDVLARWLRVLEDDWAAKDREARRSKRREKKGVAFMLALIQEQVRIGRGIGAGEGMHNLALDERELIEDLGLVEERLGDDAPKLSDTDKQAVLVEVGVAQPVLEVAADTLAEAEVVNGAVQVAKSARRLRSIYVLWADIGSSLEMILDAQRGFQQGAAQALRARLPLPPKVVTIWGQIERDLVVMLERVIQRVDALEPEAAAPAWFELAKNQLPRARESMGRCGELLGSDLKDAVAEAMDSLTRIAHVAADWRLLKMPVGRLARTLAGQERDLARQVAAADPLALALSGTDSVEKLFTVASRRIGYLEGALQGEVMSGAPDNPTEEQTQALERRLADLDGRREIALRAHGDASRAYEADGWPPSQAVVDGLDGARGALRDLWLALATFEEVVEAAAEEQAVAAKVNGQSVEAAGADDAMLPEAMRRAPFLLADQAKEQALVEGAVRRIEARLPEELAIAKAKRPAEGEVAPSVEQEEARQLAEVLAGVEGTIAAARAEVAKATSALRPPEAPTIVTGLKAVLNRARPSQEEAAALLAQALDELRRAKLGFGDVALAVMRTESLLLPIGRDLSAGVEVKTGEETQTAEGLGEVQQEVVGPLIARVPYALARTLAQLRPRGEQGAEPTDEQVAQFEQGRQALEALASQLQGAHDRAVEALSGGEAVEGREAIDLAGNVARQVWTMFADIKGLLEQGIGEETTLIARTGAFQASTEQVPDVRRQGAVTDQSRTRGLIPYMTEAVQRQATEGGGQGGGLSGEVVELAQRNLPLAEQAMVEACEKLAESLWSAARTQQEKAKRLLEEILRQLQQDQDQEQEQQDQEQQQQQPQEDRSDREKERQERAVEERNEKLKDKERQNKKRKPVKEDW
ncbi:MAG: hypothetical protein CMJ90_09635 [Planctomycetes bacterium]|nr:hypothetical protein [Planctomycetota bacterium]